VQLDGERLSKPNLATMARTLLAAGNETTRNLISGSIKALYECPEQRRQLIEDPDLIENAIDELLRWITPVRTMGRTATMDLTLGGQRTPRVAQGRDDRFVHRRACIFGSSYSLYRSVSTL
jgi:cytochrome P450